MIIAHSQAEVTPIVAQIEAQLITDQKSLFRQKIQSLSGQSEFPTEINQHWIWQALYQTNLLVFYKMVLPAQPKSIRARAIASANKLMHPSRIAADIFMYADRIIAASAGFNGVEDSKLAAAWDMVLQAGEQARIAAKKYLAGKGHSRDDQDYKLCEERIAAFDKGAIIVLENVLRIRPEGLALLRTLVKDEDITRRNKCLRKYLFLEPSLTVQSELQALVEEFDRNHLLAAKHAIETQQAEIRNALIANVMPKVTQKPESKPRLLPNIPGPKSFLAALVAHGVTQALDNAIKAAQQNGVLEPVELTEDQETTDKLLGEDLALLRRADHVVGMPKDTLKVQPKLRGKAIDLTNANPQQFKIRNIIATAKQIIEKHVVATTEEVRDKGFRGGRLALAALVFTFTMVSIGISIALPALMPLAIAAATFLILASASFLYFQRDPIPRAGIGIKTGAVTVFDRLIGFFKAVAKPVVKAVPVFEFDASTYDNIRALGIEPAKITAHFKQRYDTSVTEDQTAGVTNEVVDKLLADWKQIFAAAKDNDRDALSKSLLEHLKVDYVCVERPQFILAAEGRKHAWDGQHQRVEPVLFRSMREQIQDTLEMVQNIERARSAITLR